MKKLAAVFLLVILAAVWTGGCSIAKKDTLTVGMELAYPPFETKDENGEPYGVSVELALELGKFLGRPVKIENINWTGLIPALETGRVDVVNSSMTVTEDRKIQVDFSDPYATAYLALLVNRETPAESVEDLNREGVVIAVKMGTTGHIYAENNLQKADLTVLSSENACVTEVIQGKADAFIYDQLTIYRQSKLHPEETKALLIPFQEGEKWAAAVKKGNSELLQQINEFIRHYREEGGFERLTEKYLAEEKEVFDSLGFRWFFE